MSQEQRLWIMDHDEIKTLAQRFAGQPVVLLVDPFLGLIQTEGVALESIMGDLGAFVELLLRHDDPPLGVQADVAHQRHEGVKDLGNAAAERGGVDVEHPGSLEAFRQLPDLLDQRADHHALVVGQKLVAHMDFLQQKRPPCVNCLDTESGRPREPSRRWLPG